MAQFQKSGYVLVDSIDEIDLKRVHIQDLGKRFVDRQGNRFALRFDLEHRRIRLVRLATSRAEADRIRSEVLRKRREGRHEDMELFLEPDDTESLFPGQVARGDAMPGISRGAPTPDFVIPSASGAPANATAGSGTSPTASRDSTLTDPFGEPPQPPRSAKSSSGLLDIVDSGFFDDFSEPGVSRVTEADLFPEMDKEIARITDSQKAIIRSISRSGVLDRFEGADEFYILSKNIDEKCIQAGASALRLYQELHTFPKSPIHYLQGFPDAIRKEIEGLIDERSQIERIRVYELHRVFGSILKAILEMTVEMRRWIERFPPEEKRKKYYEDLIPSFAEITGRASSLQHRLEEWFRSSLPQKTL